MQIITTVVAAELANLPGAGKVAADLTAYKAVVTDLKVLPTGYSEWIKVTCDAGEKIKEVKASLAAAGDALGTRVQIVQHAKVDQFCYVRVQPAAKPRAKRSAGNGKVTLVPPVSIPECACYGLLFAA